MLRRVLESRDTGPYKRGCIIVVGGTDSGSFPKSHAIQWRLRGPVDWTGLGCGVDSTDSCLTTDGFVTELSPKGRLLFSTYLGGKSTDESFDVGARNGSIDVLSSTNSADFPGLPNGQKGPPGSGYVLSTIRRPR